MPKKLYDYHHHDTPVQGMANIFWWLTWSDVAEEEGVDLSGQAIDRIAPPAPPEAYALAERYMGKIEGHFNTSWPRLLARAWEADYRKGCKIAETQSDYIVGKATPDPEDYHGDYALRFGECLAYMCMGHGISWFDDHAEFVIQNVNGTETEFDVPHLESGEVHVELEDLARHTLQGKNRQKYRWR